MPKTAVPAVTVLGVFALALTMTSAQQVFTLQGGAGGGGGFNFGGAPPSPEDMAKMRMDFMARRLDDQKLSEAEKTAALDAVKVKNEARIRLQERLNSLRETADDQKATDDEVKKALNDFVKAQMDYNNSVAAADLALVKKVSVRTRAKLTVLGVVENGIGAGGGGFGGGARTPRGPRPDGGGAGPGAPGGPGKRSGARLDARLEMKHDKASSRDSHRKLDKKLEKLASRSGQQPSHE